MNTRGLWFAVAAYGLWGFLPIYWKLLNAVPSLQILLHRMVWSLGFLLVLLLFSNDWQWLKQVRKEPKTLLVYLLAAFLLTCNWGIYIWAVNANFIVETSLGYFISPLVSVFVGVLFFKEKLRKGQWFAIATATLGVITLTVVYGRLPWIALSLAFSWNVYAAFKKLAPLTSLRGLTLETALIFPAALAALIYFQATGQGQFGHSGAVTFLLIVSGVVTAVPLLFFTAAAKRLSLSLLGIMQYLAPTLQLLIGVFLFNEYFDSGRLLGFSIIWLSLIIYSFESINHRRQLRLVAS